VEVEGKAAAASVNLSLPIARAAETNLLGNETSEVTRSGGIISFPIKPWKIKNVNVGG
jgi:hypothetical protein